MPTSYCHLAVHIIFSTKGHNRTITVEKRDELHHYIGGIINNVHGRSIIVGGTDDHVHVLSLLPKEMSISNFVRAIKANSSKWFHEKFHSDFAWQEGYAAYAVSKSNVEVVRSYISNQEEHHKKETCLEESTKYLCIHGFVE